ncbi:hypothetical protein MSG28_013464 [Choristoneura fumiferana]|uniref:Uncharacterized protein n=1 Tax=Choristoneura fumiferana TaxID=7141 RepID=A0ACC0KUE4_CHOFU|nr:hypothetical protein MSG28_013464 [Choristoneura fumiferana]
MGFPAEKLEGVYRNHIDEVYRFLEKKHKDHYRIYNLCSERSYDSSKFHERVVRYAFDDHTPPNMELILPFCEDVHSWLNADPRNVAAVHCKAGKGRTVSRRRRQTRRYSFTGRRGRTTRKRRYVEYFAALVRSRLQYTATKVHIRELIMSPPPTVNGGQCSLELTVSQAAPPLKAPAGCHEVRRGGGAVSVALTHCTPLWGDVRVDVATKTKMYMRKEKLFHFWFNTFFLAAGADAEPFTGAGRAATPPSSSASSGSEADTEPDSHWDSGARVERVGRYRPLSPDTERAQNT